MVCAIAYANLDNKSMVRAIAYDNMLNYEILVRKKLKHELQGQTLPSCFNYNIIKITISFFKIFFISLKFLFQIDEIVILMI